MKSRKITMNIKLYRQIKLKILLYVVNIALNKIKISLKNIFYLDMNIAIHKIYKI